MKCKECSRKATKFAGDEYPNFVHHFCKTCYEKYCSNLNHRQRIKGEIPKEKKNKKTI